MRYKTLFSFLCTFQEQEKRFGVYNVNCYMHVPSQNGEKKLKLVRFWGGIESVSFEISRQIFSYVFE